VGPVTITYQWRGEFDNAEVDALHAEGFGHAPRGRDWRGQVDRHSLGWVWARAGEALVGFVNVAWDGGGHAVVLDTVVAKRLRRQRAGVGLLAVASQGARSAGCAWLHVDFEAHLGAFYLGACGFTATGAPLIALAPPGRR
jgi:hypothetical protein